MPNVRKIDAVEAGWSDLLNRVGSQAEYFEYLRGKGYYWAMIRLLEYPPDAWADPMWRTNAAGWVAANMPELVQRQRIIESGRERYIYRLTKEGRELAERFAAYERGRDA